MGKDLVKLLNEALIKAEELEEKNKQLEKELGNANVERWKMKQEIETLKGDVQRWKSVAFKKN